MIATLFLATAPLVNEAFEVAPRPLEWGVLENRVFDLRWTLPERRREGRDLLAEMRALVAARFELQANGKRSTGTFGDLVAEARDLDENARIEWLAGLRERAPRFMTDWGGGLEQLVLDEYLFSDDWKPKKDHARDGILTADGWELEREYGAPWTEVGVDVRFEQAAVLIYADLASIKEVENDYGTYLEHVGADYEAIYPLEDRHYRGLDSAAQPFSALAIKFRCDLPFPYSDYTCRLKILNRFADDGTARTDIYSTSSDFYYLAGRDVFLPVADSASNRTAYLLVRHFGFDLDGVPDAAKHRATAIRSSLGNLKLKAERRFADSSGFSERPEAFTHFRVLGVK